MENTFWTAFATSSLAAAVTATGIYTIRRFTAWGQRNTTYFMCFAAGVLIAASFLHIIPKSFGMTPHAPAWLLAGFLGLHLFNRFLTAFVCEGSTYPGLRHRCRPHARHRLPLVHRRLHHSIAFSVSILTGYLATVGMVLHEFPEGIITYLLLLRGGFSERRAAYMALLAAAMTTPLGMLISYPLVSAIDHHELGALLAASAGALVYVGATRICCRAPNRSRGTTAWSRWPAACWSP